MPPLALVPTTVEVVFETALGPVVADIHVELAPLTAASFLRYIDEGLYEAASFYRAARPDNESRPLRIIQGGLGARYEDHPLLPPVAHESTAVTGLSHCDGALSAARWAVGTASSEFFVVIGDTPALDHGGALSADGLGFAVFGQVRSGMKTIHDINALRTGIAPELGKLSMQGLVPPVAMRIVRGVS